MKILKLSFENINSLKGKWQIDFEDPAFDNNSIFAITGETGAGKSSILDAICLALYGKSPRQKSISQSHNHLMTTGTAFVRSEVVFSINDTIYRAFWSQHRAEYKPDGKLQAIKREFAKLEHSQDNQGKILEEKASQVDKAIKELLGMDMEQFTRSVMLPQGGFSAFLQSDKEERGKLLEQITGTHIYALIGQAVFQKNKEQGKHMDIINAKLSTIDCRSDDDYQALINKKDEQNQQLTQINEQLIHQQTLLKTTQKAQELNNDIAIWTQKHQDADQALHDFKPNQQRLTLANIATKLNTPYQALKHTEQLITDEKQALDNAQSNLPQLTAIHQNHDTLLKAAQQKLNDSQFAYEQLLPILAQVGQIDSQIDKLNHTLTLENERLNEKQQEYTQKQQEYDEQTQQKHQYTQELSTLDNQLSTSLNSINWQTLLPKLQEKYHQFIHDYRDISEYTDELNHHYENFLTQFNTIHQKRQEYQTFKNSMMADSENKLHQDRLSITQLLKDNPFIYHQFPKFFDLASKHTEFLGLFNEVNLVYTKQLQDIKSIYQSLLQAKETYIHQINSINQELDEQNTQLSNHTDNLAKVEQQFNELTTQYQDITQQEKVVAQDYENLLQQSYIYHLSLNLEDNSPCPVCGSEHHPKHHTPTDNSLLDSQLAHSKETLDTLKEQKTLLQTQLNDIKVQLTTLTHRIESNHQAIDKNNTLKQEQFTQLHHYFIELIHKNTLGDKPDDNPYLNNLQSSEISTLSDIQAILDKITSRIHDDEVTNKQLISLFNLLYQHYHEYQERHKEQALLIQNGIETSEQLYHLYQCYTHGYDNIQHAIQKLLTDNKELLDLLSDFHQVEFIDDFNYKINDFYQLLHQDYQTLIDNHTQFDKEILKKLPQTQCPNLPKLMACTTQTPPSIIDFFTQFMDNLKLAEQNLQTIAQQKNTLTHKITHLDEKLTLIYQQLQAYPKLLDEMTTKQHSLIHQISTQQEQRIQLFGYDDITTVQNTHQQILKDCQQQLQYAQDTYHQSKAQLEQLLTTINHHQEQLNKLHQQFATAQITWQETLNNSVFNNTDEFLSALMDESELISLQTHYDILLANKQHSQITLDDRLEQLSLIKAQYPQIETYELSVIESQLNTIKQDYDLLNQYLGQLIEQIENETKKRQQRQNLLEQLNHHKQESLIWQKLDTLIGDSKGQKYRNFAQGLTLDLVLANANDLLEKMNDRYLLTRPDDDYGNLEICVTDLHQGGIIRPTSNLSGGETFVISLALALGLSQINSRFIKIESLFLDEGFGTLDENSLDTALNTLFELQQSGKSIGIISHVASLKERIDTQIVIEKQSKGISILRGAGVSQG